MYWAIATLPPAIVDVRKALEFERGFPAQIFPFLKDAETVERSPQEWQRILEQSVIDVGKLTSDLQMANACVRFNEQVNMHFEYPSWRTGMEPKFEKIDIQASCNRSHRPTSLAVDDTPPPGDCASALRRRFATHLPSSRS